MAAALKEGNDRVLIGPSTDGGYYAIGMREAHVRLFQDITWDADRVCDQTIERAKEIAVPATRLPAWYDVDDQFSLERLLSELFPERAKEAAPKGAPASNTRAFLNEMLAREGSARIWPNGTP
jgi:hypothetical protein